MIPLGESLCSLKTPRSLLGWEGCQLCQLGQCGSVGSGAGLEGLLGLQSPGQGGAAAPAAWGELALAVAWKPSECGCPGVFPALLGLWGLCVRALLQGPEPTEPSAAQASTHRVPECHIHASVNPSRNGDSQFSYQHFLSVVIEFWFYCGKTCCPLIYCKSKDSRAAQTLITASSACLPGEIWMNLILLFCNIKNKG